MKLEEIQENHQKILQMEVDHELPEFQKEMIGREVMKEALVFHQCQINQKLFYRYELHGMKSVLNFFRDERVDIEMMKSLMNQVVFLLEKKTDYLLGENQIIWEPQWLFWENGEIYVVIVPDGLTNEKDSLYRLIEFFMEIMDTDNREQVLFVYGLYRLLKENDDFFLLLKQYIQEKLPEPVKLPEKVKPKKIQVAEVKENSKKGIWKHIKRLTKRKEEIIHWSNETVVLTPESWLPILTPVSGIGASFSIAPLPYIIGKNPEQVNGVVNHESVSRIHGKLYRDVGKLYYMDQDSTNGTYINGCRLPAYEECEIKSGDSLQFGTVEYQLN